ncbi:hypothetical protein POM88_007248 [Heracleum sosnowskyi]|uniref:Helitron helicase-like domain-containing protein n=1 Tax=Heracleum sosnowskyi TaxID=360622 RepID=A0AAD8J423_9APIA|nr:hypothetical protein POM88_007248 [Heracleum sosnowskyi]
MQSMTSVILTVLYDDGADRAFSFLLSQDDGADRAFSSEDMMKGFPRFHTRRKKVSNNKENIDSNKTNTADRSPLSPFSEIFNTPAEISLTNKVSSVNKFNIHTSSSGLKKTMAAQERIDREPLSNITNENAYSTSRGRKEKGKGKLRHQQSNGTRLEAEFNSTLQQTYDEYFDQLEHSIIADSSLTEDGLDDSNDEFCTEEAWGENVDSDSDVGNATLRAPKVGNQSWRRCDVPHEYATLGPPSVKCTKCHAIMWREERVNKNVTKGTPIFSLCCKKGDVTLPNALPTPPFLLQLYDDELKDGYHNKIPFTSAPPNTLNDRDMISMKDYYSYRFQVRENEGMTARVFKMKLDQMTHDIKKKSYFGKCVGIMYVVEFQKRGLPHVHMLIWLDSESKRVLDVAGTFLKGTVPAPFLMIVCSKGGLPPQIRQLFVHIVVNCKVTDLLNLWSCHWKQMIDDILLKRRSLSQDTTLTLADKQLQYYALAEIDDLLRSIGKSLKSYPQLPQPPSSYLNHGGMATDVTQNIVYREVFYALPRL